MEAETRYLIEPRPELRSHLVDGIDPDLADLLLEPLLVAQRHGCRAVLLRGSFATRIKLVYLAQIRELQGLNEDSEAKRVLGSGGISVAVFDRWWTIREITDWEDVDDMISVYGALLVKAHDTGDEWVDDWLKTLKRTV